jgi:hypothetical protein
MYATSIPRAGSTGENGQLRRLVLEGTDPQDASPGLNTDVDDLLPAVGVRVAGRLIESSRSDPHVAGVDARINIGAAAY